ncbi:MAG TPA: hypothetical protein VFS05_01980, partial [Gemmatimonadaceae bacterium]|nr:hypothetical protein [Gemmatimonadaceae bacterium]
MNRRPGAPWLISVALHIVLGAGLAWVITRHGPLDDWWKKEKRTPAPVAERIGFISVPQGPVTTPGKSGGDGR